MTIRDATSADIPAMADLITQLGYPTTPDEMGIRFRVIDENPDYKTFLAESDAGEVVGLLGVSRALSWEFNGCQVRIVALVVRDSARRQGVGECLIQTAEDWAKEIGAKTITLTSGNRSEREAAHQFYPSMGFVGASTGYRKAL